MEIPKGTGETVPRKIAGKLRKWVLNKEENFKEEQCSNCLLLLGAQEG